jgi:hypothetical protein
LNKGCIVLNISPISEQEIKKMEEEVFYIIIENSYYRNINGDNDFHLLKNINN